MAQLGDLSSDKRPALTASRLAADILRLVPHEHIMRQLGRYCIPNPEAAPFLTKISVAITAKGENAFDSISDQLLSGKINQRDLQTLTKFAVSLYKDFPTGMSLVTESHSDGELWHSLDGLGTELRWIFYVSPTRAKRLEKNETIKPGFYAVSPCKEMKMDVNADEVSFIKLFHCYYGIDHRPVFLGDLEYIPQQITGTQMGPSSSSSSSSGVMDHNSMSSADIDKRYVTSLFSAPAGSSEQRARSKDAQVRHPRNTDYFQFVLPHGMPYSGGEGGAALTRAFIAKILEVCFEEVKEERSQADVRFEDLVTGLTTVRFSHLQATHNIGLPFPVIPKPTWRLVALLDANDQPLPVQPLVAALDKVASLSTMSSASVAAMTRIATPGSGHDDSSSKKKKKFGKTGRRQAISSGSMYQ